MASKKLLRWEEDQLETASATLEQWLQRDKALRHLHVKRRGTSLTFHNDDVEHARLTLVGRDVWGLSLPRHTGRWEKTPFLGALDDVYGTLTGMLGFHLAER